MKGTQVKMVAHADDMYVLFSDKFEVQALKQLISEYGEASGVIINENKSKCFLLTPGVQDIVCHPMGVTNATKQRSVVGDTV